MENDNTKIISFLPWLRIDASIGIGRFTFIPFLGTEDPDDERVREIIDVVRAILSGYVDLRGKALGNCVLVLDSQVTPSWNLRLSDLCEARWAAAQLFLSAFSVNEYFLQDGQRANSSMFAMYHQSFTLPIDFIAVNSRRRDGQMMVGGYRHGEIKSTVPVSANVTEPSLQFDMELLEALGRAFHNKSPVLRRLRAALSFLILANTDSDSMVQDAEVILMISAYEQLLAPSEFGARHLARSLSALFDKFSSIAVTVNQALTNRPGVRVEPEYANEQRNWRIHRKWMEEFYQLRNSCAHGNPVAAQSWGWVPFEHLVMAAVVFPLTLKLLLSAEGHYNLSRSDEIMCAAIDGLLKEVDWAEENANRSRWQEILRSARSENRVARAVQKWQQKDIY